MDWLTADVARWGPLGAAAVAGVLALVAHRIGRTVLRRVVRFAPTAASVLRRIERPSQLLLPLVAIAMAWQAVPPEHVRWLPAAIHANGVLIILAVTWLAIGAVGGLADAVMARHPLDVADNLQARRIHTQTRVLARTAMGVIIVAGVAFALMTFPGARQLGASLLASAGIVGLVAGIAARSVFSNLMAGLQIALGQPIRIDDVLVVEGEWGRVEEITATYVVLKIWDQRRLIIPLQWLIEHPFQNWTRSEAQIIGSVFLWVDYTTPLEPLRAEARRLCEASPDWDGRVCVLQVTEAGEHAMQLRVLVSSPSSGQAWDLRCAVREGLVGFLQRTHPDALPRVRAQWDARGEPAPGPAA